MHIGILSLGFSNISSILKAISTLGYEGKVIESKDEFIHIDKLIFPGVGHFQYAMTTLKKTGLSDLIVKHCEENKPLLGICLGMQLLFESSEEGDGTCQGLAFIPGKVEKIIPANQDEKIPHNGWNEVNITQTDDILWKNIDSNKDFYFNHSYAAKTQPQYVIGQTPFAGGIISAVRKHNAWGVQFHPEKSQSLGKILLQNFLNNHD